MKLVNTSKLYSAIDTSVEELAAQFTIIDLPIFKSIKRDELTSLANHGSSTSKYKKQDLSPNLVAMNRQFNQVTFWVVGQILHQNTPRLRAEYISYFIKTAKQLHNLNNLHSSYAVVSAILSSPIYRLEKTWSYVRRKYPKEKQKLEQLKEFFSDNNNYELLRDHLSSCNLPCIPYLGVYSRDIIYINEAYQKETIQSSKCTSKILESIERFQLSDYNNLLQVPRIYQYLLSSRYLDELQKFVEEENYRKSLELEPPHSNSHNKSNSNNNSYSNSKSSNNSNNNTNPTTVIRQSINNLRYLIDDSFIDQNTSLPSPISTSS